MMIYSIPLLAIGVAKQSPDQPRQDLADGVGTNKKCGFPIWENSEEYWYLMLKKFVFLKGFR